MTWQKSIRATLIESSQYVAAHGSLAAGIVLCPRLSLIIAAAAIGEKLGVIDASVNAAIVLVAIVTVTASPLAFLKIYPAQRVKVAGSMATDTTLAAPGRPD